MEANELLHQLIDMLSASQAMSGNIKGYRSKSGEIFFRKECNAIQLFTEAYDSEDSKKVISFVTSLANVTVLNDWESGFIEVWVSKT